MAIGAWQSLGTTDTSANASYDTMSTTMTDATSIGWKFYPTPIGGGTNPTVHVPATRSAPPQEFNKYISASDLLEEFIRWLGEQGLRQKEVSSQPLEYFIKWLVIRACEEDQEEPNVELPALPPPKAFHRCVGCGRFMPLAITLALHAWCSASYFSRSPTTVRQSRS